MTIRKPPSPLTRPQFSVLPAGTALHRVARPASTEVEVKRHDHARHRGTTRSRQRHPTAFAMRRPTQGRSASCADPIRAISRTPTSWSPGSRSISRPPTVRVHVSGHVRSGLPRHSFPGDRRGRGGSIRRSVLPSSTRETVLWTTAGPPTSRPASNATRRTSSTPARRCSASEAITT